MSTRVTDFLHELISSLTKSEKRYFKLLSSRHTIGEENNYVLLFDFIDKQNEYNEEHVFDHFHGQAFLNRFSITKKRLYNHILSALDSFHSQSSIQAQLHKMLHSADILIHKTLYAQATKLLRSAEKLAQKNEALNILIDIRKKQKILQEKNNFMDLSELELNTISETDTDYHKQSLYEDKLWNIKSRLLQQMILHGQVRSIENEKTFETIYNELQGLNKPKTATLEAQYLRLHIESAYHFALQHYQESLTAMEQNLNLFEKNKDLLDKHPERYFSLLTNLVYTSDHLGCFDKSEIYLAALKKFEAIVNQLPDIDLQMKLFTTISSINLSFSTRRGNYEDATSFIPEIKEGLNKFGEKISGARNAFLQFKMATIYLSIGENNLALKAIRTILNDTSLDKKEDIVAFAHLLELFIHIELGDVEYLPYARTSTIRFLKKRNRFYAFEEALLTFAKKYVNVTNKFDAMEKWEELHEKLQKLSEDPYQASALEYFDFISWAEAKSKDVSFLKVCQDKFNSRLKKAS